MKIAFIIGTRPELIKVAPIIWALKKTDISFDVVNTAQHKDLLEPYWKTFNIEPTHILDVMVSGQNLASLTSRAISQIQNYLDNVSVKPTIILAQGDTTTVMASSMVSFYNDIKFAHIEAGLRSFDFYNPFPEEYNRRIASITANFHFCPTSISQNNLLNEGILENKIFVVGNTVVDSLSKVSNSNDFDQTPWVNKLLERVNCFENVVLITCHRRENHGDNLIEIIESISQLAKENSLDLFLWPLHPNPNVKQKILGSDLSKLENVILTGPLEYLDILKVLNIAFCAISDSGGIQEEAPSFNTPVLVLRETTERPEGVTSGVAFLVGADKKKITSKFNDLKKHKIYFDRNPYGDGQASEKIVDILLNDFLIN
ncbi:MAG: UDP-N-acetylglucosamine 2-epimerase (non-hydrolyzing) [Algoriphagus sp.]|nr:UDP-N-acetylglucosamine 2-epimerase (non-hydrolyzing) [Algoriphagus sp.]